MVAGPGRTSGVRAMSGFGEELRLEREGRGVSLEWLCAETKVQPRHFSALERGEFHELPGGVFRKGIVRAYLHALSLEEEAWMPKFDASFAAHAAARGEQGVPAEEAWVEFASNVKKNRVGTRQRNGLRWLGVFVMLVILATAGWAVWEYVLKVRGRELATGLAIDPQASDDEAAQAERGLLDQVVGGDGADEEAEPVLGELADPGDRSEGGGVSLVQPEGLPEIDAVGEDAYPDDGFEVEQAADDGGRVARTPEQEDRDCEAGEGVADREIEVVLETGGEGSCRQR